MKFVSTALQLLVVMWLQRRQEEMEREGQYPALPGSIEPPHVNICPPSPQNNKDPKTSNFNV